MVRVDPAEAEGLRSAAGVDAMVMRGRPLRGWLEVEPAALSDDAELEAWVQWGVAYARALPVKSAG